MAGPASNAAARRKFNRPPVKVACLACRASRIRCDGQTKCSNCISKKRTCSYVPSNRGGPRDCRNRKRRRLSTPPPDTIDENQDPALLSMDTEADDGLDFWTQLMGLSEPGAGLRSVESSIADMEQAFDRIFAGEGDQAAQLVDRDPSLSSFVQLYGCNEDLLDAYYVFIHIFLPVLPPPEHIPVSNRPLSGKSTSFQPPSPLALAIAALLALIPHPDAKPSFSESNANVKLRRDQAHFFAQSALEAVDQDLELLDSSSDPSAALSDGDNAAPQFQREPFHPRVPVCLEAVLALVLLSTYEYAQRGNIRKMCNRAGQALTAAMHMSLHEMVVEDEFAEACRRGWWMTYMAVCQGSIVSGTPPAFNVYDPRFVTPYPQVAGWKLLIEAQQTILEATTFVHDLDRIAQGNCEAPWIATRMLDLDAQIARLLSSSSSSSPSPPSPSSPMTPLGTDSPEKLAQLSIKNIAQIKLHSARIKIHRFCAFSDLPVFRKRHCDLQVATTISPCCRQLRPQVQSQASSTPEDPEPEPGPEPSSPSSSQSQSQSQSQAWKPNFPFSSHASARICLQAALSIVALLDSLPFPNPDHQPLQTQTGSGGGGEAKGMRRPRTMPTFACCIMQSSYAILMLLLRARSMSMPVQADMECMSLRSRSLSEFMEELQERLRTVEGVLDNYAIAFEALRGMRDEISHWVSSI